MRSVELCPNPGPGGLAQVLMHQGGSASLTLPVALRTPFGTQMLSLGKCAFGTVLQPGGTPCCLYEMAFSDWLLEQFVNILLKSDIYLKRIACLVNLVSSVMDFL